MLEANQELTKRCLVLDVENEGAKSAHATLMTDRRGLEAKLAAADGAVRALKEDQASSARDLQEKAAAMSSLETQARRLKSELSRVRAELESSEEQKVKAQMELTRTEAERSNLLFRMSSAAHGKPEAERPAKALDPQQSSEPQRQLAEEEAAIYRELLDAEKAASQQAVDKLRQVEQLQLVTAEKLAATRASLSVAVSQVDVDDPSYTRNITYQRVSLTHYTRVIPILNRGLRRPELCLHIVCLADALLTMWGCGRLASRSKS